MEHIEYSNGRPTAGGAGAGPEGGAWISVDPAGVEANGGMPAAYPKGRIRDAERPRATPDSGMARAGLRKCPERAPFPPPRKPARLPAHASTGRGQWGSGVRLGIWRRRPSRSQLQRRFARPELSVVNCAKSDWE